MTVKEVMQKIRKENIGDIDFCDDYDERAYVAYCGNNWTPEAEEKYARAFNLPVDEKNSRFGSNYDIVIVHCATDMDAQALRDLLFAMAGYIAESEYDRLFPEDPEEPEPERKTVEVVLRNGEGVMKAKQVEFEDGMLAVLGTDDEWRKIDMQKVLRIIGEE